MAVTNFLEEQFSLNADFASSIWNVTDLECGSLQLVWTGADASNEAEAVPQSSNDKENWNDMSLTFGVSILDTAAGTQIWEIERFTTRYIRVCYLANGNSGGTARIIAWAHPLRYSM